MPSAAHRLRWTAFGLATLMLVWIPIEDTSILVAQLFSLAISLLLAVTWLNRRNPVRLWHGWEMPIAGAAGGLLTGPLALALMAFKTGVHGHGFPDFSPAQVQTVLTLALLWPPAGLLIGTGAELLRRRNR
jgi:hypothetical protein